MRTRLLTLAAAISVATACSEAPAPADTAKTAEPVAAETMTKSTNPLFTASPLQYQAPQFDLIKDEHYKPALEAGIAEQLKEVAAIANNPDAPTFENTLVAMEKTGVLLNRAASVFYNLAGSSSNDTIRAIQGEMAPKMAAHNDDIYLNAKLFARVDALYQKKDELGLDAESMRLLEVYYRDFVLAGAKLTADEQVKIRALNEEEASLTNTFRQRLMAHRDETAVVVDSKEELAGLSEGQIAILKAAAEEKGLEGKYLIYITNTTRQPILANMDNRALRQRVWEASTERGVSGESETHSLVQRLVALRAEKAQLLGYDTWADYRLAKAMAKTPGAVRDMFSSMVPKVVANVEKEAQAIEEMIKASGGDFELQAWDWAYYANKVRADKYALDENEVKAYFEFNTVLEKGVFYTMNRLFGVTFKPRPDLPLYHPDVLPYEVFDADGTSIAIFYGDYFAREGKRGGAWMSSFVKQTGLLEQKPVIVNVMNIEKAPEGQPTLVSYDHTTTIFHELGHGLHGIFSDVKYPSLSGTSVSRDFVEFPSTFQEDWASHPEVLANYAMHYKTGEPMPKELLDKVLASRSFNQGFDTLEYMSAALLDMEWHSLPAGEKVEDVNKFEADALSKNGVNINYVLPRYRSGYFSHAFPGGYSASYYAYMWSEILAADAFAYVRDTGSLTRENGDKFRKHILSVGNSIDPMETYKAFRGEAPKTTALLERRGLL
ncbi:M3 family metallopeptidase [Corallincola platygyrae]|uniref:M3 family metallopeptidase n=1 Tax=Corallincola platygyrae TaxID=1193278 RepID=A0ABW4XJW2_9GAMM